LELDGVLKSWAVPKGPSVDPAQKRLAVHVEDHPVDYGGFEGVIPQRQYGGGTVMLWDRGSWEPVGDAREGYRSGKLKFQLHGEKLSGGWMLVRTRGSLSRQWLLIKERDASVRPSDEYDVTEEEPLSVASQRDLAQIAAAGDRVWNSSAKSNGSNHKAAKPGKRSKARTTVKVRAPRKRRALPASVKPQLATLVEKPPEGEGWLHEIKFDGYRILAYVDGDKVRLKSRNDLDWTAKFPELAKAVGRGKARQVILDGEVVALNEHGVSDFQALQSALTSHKRGGLIYYVFDLLWLDGEDLRGLPLAERKPRLESLKLPVDRGPLRFAEHVRANGADFFAEAERLGLEGIISKRQDQPYKPGRGSDWLKIKCATRSEFVIGGFTDPGGARQGFGALLLGYYDKARDFKYAGRVGTGFNDRLLKDLSKKLHGIEVSKPPFSGVAIKRERHAHWVRPNLVAEVRYSNWTRDGLLRHPAFLGLREDKPAKSVHREKPQRLAKLKPAATPKKNAAPHSRSAKKPASADGSREASIAGRRLTHPDKVLYPDDGLTKRDLAEYYQKVAHWMLPHVAGRPLSIVRCPDGLAGQRFFQKHPTAGMLSNLERVMVTEKHARREYVVINSAADLVDLVQIGALELHVWGSRADAIERPDCLIFDLDPAPEVAWKQVCSAARRIRELLRELGLESFLKTSGGKGLHLAVPIARRHDWEFVNSFCHAVASAIARAAPDEFVATMSKAVRGGKIYVDYLRNQRGATAVAAYSTRARPGAPVSMPIAWEELTAVTSSDQFRVASAVGRLQRLKRDPWAAMGRTRQSLSAAMIRKLEG
jgi:bifunctional non-homologous end joining protein LigD